MTADDKSEFDPGGDDRSPLQRAYGARTGRFGDAEGDTFAGLDPIEEARRRLAAARQERS